MSKRYRKQQFALLVITAVSLACGSAWASGFLIHEQAASGLGTAYAGTAALAEKDAGTGFYNSAGLAGLCEEQVAVSGIYIIPRSRFIPTAATNTANTALSNPTIGVARAQGEAVVPGLHYFRRLDDCWTLPLTLNSER